MARVVAEALRPELLLHKEAFCDGTIDERLRLNSIVADKNFCMKTKATTSTCQYQSLCSTWCSRDISNQTITEMFSWQKISEQISGK